MLHYQTTEKTALFYYCSRRTWSMSFILLLFLELLSQELSRKIRRNPPLLPTPFPLTFSPFWSLPLPSMNTTPTFFSPSPLPPHLTILLFHLFIKKKILNHILTISPHLQWLSHFLPLSPPSIPLKHSKGIICPLSLWGDSGGHSTACYTRKPNSLLTVI